MKLYYEIISRRASLSLSEEFRKARKHRFVVLLLWNYIAYYCLQVQGYDHLEYLCVQCDLLHWKMIQNVLLEQFKDDKRKI